LKEVTPSRISSGFPPPRRGLGESRYADRHVAGECRRQPVYTADGTHGPHSPRFALRWPSAHWSGLAGNRATAKRLCTASEDAAQSAAGNLASSRRESSRASTAPRQAESMRESEAFRRSQRHLRGSVDMEIGHDFTRQRRPARRPAQIAASTPAVQADEPVPRRRRVRRWKTQHVEPT